MVRSVVLVGLLVGCGRIGFDTVDDDTGPTTPISLELPEGGTFESIAVAPDGAWYVGATNVGFWRSDDHQTWIPCGAAKGEDIVIANDGTIYIAGSDVFESTDRCATWVPTNLGRHANGVGTQNGSVFALVDDGIRRRNGTAWTGITTPADGMPFTSMVSTANRLLVATDGAGLLVEDQTGWHQTTAGLDTLEVGAVAIAPTKMYAITLANPTGNSGAMSCSDGMGLAWRTCQMEGGRAIAVDPTDPLHVVVSPYDQLGQSTDGLATYDNDKQKFGMDVANVTEIAFTATGEVLAISGSGVYYAPDRALVWERRVTGLSSWNVQGMLVAGDDVFLGTHAGMLRSTRGGPFTVSTTGMTLSTTGKRIAIAPDGSVIFPGRQVWRSTDRGDTWTALTDLQGNDNYNATAALFIGDRMFVSTYKRVIVADPPYTTWTPYKILNIDRQILVLHYSGGRMYAGTEDGLFVSADQAQTWQPIAEVTTYTFEVVELPDGGLAVGTGDGMWISDPTRATWLHGGVSGDDVLGFAMLPGGGIAAGTNHGVTISMDRGVTWVPLASTANYNVRALFYEAASDQLVLGVIGAGLVRVPF